ncbi:uncharacterized protein LOC143183420 [Calliopsis andreniformis]|uniref:uncharacterized protein LOC143183420 n=1 Tax=Calliopsis andreniformis TaxID=337506 RepID=UPI003FCC3F7A
MNFPPTTKVVEAKRPKVPTRTETKALSEEASRTLTNGCNGPMETGRTTKREVSGIIHQLNRNLTVINKTDRSGPRAIDRIKNRLLQAEQVRVSDGKSRTESIETPVDGAGPPTVLLKGVVRPNKKDLESQEIQERDPSKDYDNFAYELLYHAEYHDDLPIVEYEREELSPRLSDDYLKKHLNGEQRRLVVMFMIRIGTHCRYPSYIVYQAVKLFDAAMDRIHVETPYIQIIALVSLWIALKAHQNFHKIPSAQTMISLAGELYKNRQDLLIKYERKILMALNFNITFADTFSLFTHYLISCKRCITFSEDAIAFIYHSGGYLIDLTLLDEHFCRTSANLIALAAAELILGLVMDTVTINARPKWLFWRGLLFGTSPQVSSKFPGEDIDRSRVQMLNRVISSASRQTGFEVVYKKYSRSRYGKISAFLLERASRLSYLETLIP